MKIDWGWPMKGGETVEGWCKDWGHDGEPLLVRRLREAVPEQYLADALYAVTSVCPFCRDAERGCRCQDDS